MLIPILKPPFVATVPGGGGLTPLRAAQAVPAGMPILITEANFAGAPHSGAIWSDAFANGGAVRVWQDSGKSVRLPVEVESYNAGANTCRLWTRNPAAMALNDELYIALHDAGDGTTQPAVDAQYGVQEVWQDITFCSHDFTQNLRTAFAWTITGTVLDNSGPAGAQARGFWTSGVDADDVINTGYQGDDPLSTIIVSARTDEIFNSGLDRQAILSNGHENLTYLSHSNTDLQVLHSAPSGAGTWEYDPPLENVWERWFVIYDGSNATNVPTVYRNGALHPLDRQFAPGGTPYTGNHAYRIGQQFNTGQDATFRGHIAEIRFVHGALYDAAYAAAEYANVHAPGTFMPAQARL